MSSTLFDRGSLPVLESILNFTAARHKAIANNIANVETAAYRTLDVPVADFERVLACAFEDQRRSPTGIFERPTSGAPRATARGLEVRTGEAGTTKPLGNDVDLDLEMGKMVKNSSLHNLAAALLAHQFNLMREAIGWRVL